MPTDRNPPVIFANPGVQKCYDFGLKKIAYFEKMMDKNLSSPPAYRLYQKLAEECDQILKMMRHGIFHVYHKADLQALYKREINEMNGKIKQKG